MGKKSPLDQHIQKLLEWNSLGVDRKEMARRLGLSHGSVQSYLQRRNISMVPQGPGKSVDKEALRRLIEQDRKTQAEAAEILGCSVSLVERASSLMGLQTSRTGPRSGQDHHQRWSGGRCLDKHGYVLVYAPLHPLASNTGYLREHRAVCEVVLGRYLKRHEVVDHIDSHPQHNWPENLRVYSSNADHLRATLTDREKATPRSSIPGAYGSNQRILRCPELRETLSQCPEETTLLYVHFVESHQPTPQHSHMARREYFRSGPARDPFRRTSTA